MSLPKFIECKDILSREQALDAIITSIAMEEVALSHIITAESEKINYVLEKIDHKKEDVKLILEVNKSASKMIEQVIDMQIILKNKLKNALEYLPKPQPMPPTPPCPKPKPPCPPPVPPLPQSCISRFSNMHSYIWKSGKALGLFHDCNCNNCIALSKIGNEYGINLPMGGIYKVDISLSINRLDKFNKKPIIIGLEQKIKDKDIFNKNYKLVDKNCEYISDTIILDCTHKKDSILILRQNSLFNIELVEAEINIIEVHK